MMILDPARPIDLGPFLHVQVLFAEVMYIDLPAGTSAFDHPKALAAMGEAAEAFPGSVEDREDEEYEIRRGLCWLLHQDDDALGAVPGLILASPIMSDHHRYLETLWASGFADWRTKGFDLDYYRAAEPSDKDELPVLIDPVVPIDFSSVFALLRQPVAADPELAHQYLLTEPGEENDSRLGLWWLLHQDDASLAGWLDRASVVLAGGVNDRRIYLERLWDRLFADWRVEGFDPADYDVTGVPGSEQR